MNEDKLDKYYNEKDEAEGKIPKLNTFEEQFPSMEKAVFYHGSNQDRIKAVPVLAVKIHCLDKQKVREVIIRNHACVCRLKEGYVCQRCETLKELGL